MINYLCSYLCISWILHVFIYLLSCPIFVSVRRARVMGGVRIICFLVRTIFVADRRKLCIGLDDCRILDVGLLCYWQPLRIYHLVLYHNIVYISNNSLYLSPKMHFLQISSYYYQFPSIFSTRLYPFIWRNSPKLP